METGNFQRLPANQVMESLLNFFVYDIISVNIGGWQSTGDRMAWQSMDDDAHQYFRSSSHALRGADRPHIDRRELLQAAGGGIAAIAGIAAAAQKSVAEVGAARPASGAPRVVFVIHHNMILIDLLGPLTFFNIMRADVHLVAKSPESVLTDVRLPVTPTNTFRDAPMDADVLCLPGGLDGTTALIQDAESLEFLAQCGARAKYVTSVCTGALALGAAGLLKGYRATTHWTVRDILPLFGAIPSDERVVEDRNRITGGGVTAGIDFGLLIASRLQGDEAAQTYQLVLEYDPHPGFQSGNPHTAEPTIVEKVRSMRAPAVARARAVVQEDLRRRRG
jgi:cyclohexyl-isocyanide hydratase